MRRFSFCGIKEKVLGIKSCSEGMSFQNGASSKQSYVLAREFVEDVIDIGVFEMYGTHHELTQGVFETYGTHHELTQGVFETYGTHHELTQGVFEMHGTHGLGNRVHGFCSGASFSSFAQPPFDPIPSSGPDSRRWINALEADSTSAAWALACD